MEQSAVLMSFVCMFTMASAASPTAMSWHGDRSGFKTALRAGRCADLENNQVENRWQSNHVAVQRRVSSMDVMYEVHGGLGKNSFAAVRQAVHKITGKIYAVKTIDLSKIRAEQQQSLRNGIELMKMLDHPKLIKVHESFEDQDELHLVLELGGGGNVFDNSSCNIMLELFEYFLLNTSVLYPPPASPSTIARA
jgi:hypothetical protein